MARRTVTRPEVRVGGHWLSSILPARGSWGGLETSEAVHGAEDASWEIAAPYGWRHPALTYGALVDVHLGPEVIWAGTLDEPDWNEGQFNALGAPRDGDDAIALDGSGVATTEPNTAIDAAIARGVIPWTRVGDFGTTPVGQESNRGRLVKLTSILNAWAEENQSGWRVDNQRRLIIAPPIGELSTPKWHVMPGSDDLGQAADKRADVVFVRYVSDASGTLATAQFPAATPASGIEAAMDVTDRGAMSAATATDIAESRWNELKGQSGWTNGLTLAHGQVTTAGGVVADLSQIHTGDTIRLLGQTDPRNGRTPFDVVIGDTSYEWAADEIQVNPVGTAARTPNAVLEQVSELAASAVEASGGVVVPEWRTGTFTWSSPTIGAGLFVETAVVFDVPFSAPPEVAPQVAIDPGGTSRLQAAATAVDENGFTLRVWNQATASTSPTSVTATWIAITATT